MNLAEFLACIREAKDAVATCDFVGSGTDLSSKAALHLKILQRNPTSIYTLAYYGYALMALGALHEHIEFFRGLLTRSSAECRLAHYFLYLALYRSGQSNWDEAQREFQNARAGFAEDNDDLNFEIIADLMAAGEPTGGIGIRHSDGNVYILTKDGQAKRAR